MKFTKREDIEAPLEVVFRAMTDFNGFTRAAMRRGIEVSRKDTLAEPGPGMAWAVRAVIRGRTRDISVRLIRVEPQQSLQCGIDSGGMLGTLDVGFLELGRGRTRVTTSLEMKAATMTARLILQSARLAKGSLDKRFARRIGDFARDIEERARRGAI